jgi:hypothetical protein
MWNMRKSRFRPYGISYQIARSCVVGGDIVAGAAKSNFASMSAYGDIYNSLRGNAGISLATSVCEDL